MSISIPPPYQPAFQKLAGLSETQAAQLMTAVKTEPAQLLPGRFIDGVAAKVEALDGQTVREILSGVLSLSLTASAAGDSASAVVPKVAASDVLALDETQRVRLARLLKDLVESDAISITAKALNVLTSHQRTLASARIFTDVRPIFREGVKNEPAAAVIVHQLAVSFQENGERSNFYVALDTRDIDRLRDVLAKAASKAANLKGVIERSGLTYIEVPSEP